MLTKQMPDPKSPDQDVQYKAHEVLISQAALLRMQTEKATDRMEELQDQIEEAIKLNHDLTQKARKEGNEIELAKLQQEDIELRQAFESLEEGHGNMQFGQQVE